MSVLETVFHLSSHAVNHGIAKEFQKFPFEKTIM